MEAALPWSNCLWWSPFLALWQRCCSRPSRSPRSPLAQHSAKTNCANSARLCKCTSRRMQTAILIAFFPRIPPATMTGPPPTSPSGTTVGGFQSSFGITPSSGPTRRITAPDIKERSKQSMPGADRVAVTATMKEGFGSDLRIILIRIAAYAFTFLQATSAWDHESLPTQEHRLRRRW